jgi:hypothetical protein
MSDGFSWVAIIESVALGMVAGAMGSIGTWGRYEDVAYVAVICVMMWLLFAHVDPPKG